MLSLTLICSLSTAPIKHLQTIKVSSKPFQINIASNSFNLAVSHVSDSMNSLPPNLSIYTIGISFAALEQVVTGPCYSLGRSLAPFEFGFYASAPSSAFRWGDPGSLLVKAIPPLEKFYKVPYKGVPYGETMGVSNRGDFVVACSPLEKDDNCLMIEQNPSGKDEDTIEKIKILKIPERVELFGLSVCVSGNGSVIAVISKLKGFDDNLVLSLFDRWLNKEIKKFIIPLNGRKISVRESCISMMFLDEKHLLLGLSDKDKIMMYKKTTGNDWVLSNSLNINILSMGKIDNNIIVNTKDGTVKIIDKNFVIKNQIKLTKTINNGTFTKITGGKDWFAILEESSDERKIHIYTVRIPSFIKCFGIFLLFVLLVVFYIFIRSKIDFSRIISKLQKRKNTKQI